MVTLQEIELKVLLSLVISSMQQVLIEVKPSSNRNLNDFTSIITLYIILVCACFGLVLAWVNLVCGGFGLA